MTVVHCRRAPYDVYVGRGSPWGNQFRIGPDGTREQVIVRYRTWVMGQPDMIAAIKRELRGKVLGCWCAPLKCHGDVLAEIAESAGEDRR